MKIYQRFLPPAVALAALMFLSAFGPALAAETAQLTILHTNDLHGKLQNFASYEGMPPGYVSDINYGGAARRAALIKQLRKEIPNPVLVLDAGDIYSFGPWDYHYGVPDIEAMNLSGYDAVTVGNHDFKATAGLDSQEKLLQLIQRSHFPWVCANLVVAGSAPPGGREQPVKGFKPYVVLPCGKLKVGILGLTIPLSSRYSQTKGWKFLDPIKTAQYWVPIARKECDVLIALTHLGEAVDEELVRNVSGIDAIVGGHSHSLISGPLGAKNPLGIEVPIVQVGCDGDFLGRLDMTFVRDGAWKLQQFKIRPIQITQDMPEDPAVKEMLKAYPIIPPPSEPEVFKPASPGPSWRTPYLATPPTIDGDLREWQKLPALRVGDKPEQVRLESRTWEGPQDCSARAWVGWNQAGLYFAADVTDDKFVQAYQGYGIYANDSIQIAFDPRLDRTVREYQADDREYCFARVGQKTDCECYQGPNSGKRLDLQAFAKVKSDGTGWTLEVRFPWAELDNLKPAPGKKLGFSWLVNDSDGGNYDHWLEWTPGVAWITDPSAYGTLELSR
jgi:5'-nucleotidase